MLFDCAIRLSKPRRCSIVKTRATCSIVRTFQRLVRLSKPKRIIPHSGTGEGLLSFTRIKQIRLPFTRLKSGLTKMTDNARETTNPTKKWLKPPQYRPFLNLKWPNLYLGRYGSRLFSGRVGVAKFPFPLIFPSTPPFDPEKGRAASFAFPN